MVKEIWMDVIDFENLYEVSNIGRVRTKKTGLIRKRQQDRNGYWRITLKDSKDKRKQSFLVHRLMMLAFVPQRGLNVVNHIDGVPSNCLLNNLEWTTYSKNNQHAYDMGLKVGAMLGITGGDSPSAKKVDQYTRDGIKIASFNSVVDAKAHTGVSAGNISSTARGERNHAGGYVWKYVV